MRLVHGGAALLLLLAAGAAGAQEADAPYLAPPFVPDGVAILPPPPAPDSAAAKADRATFEATRKLEGSPRWTIATEDVENDPLARYACAMGVALDARTAPVLAHLLDKAGTGALVGPVKDHYHARRPYLGTDAPICQPRTQHLADNGDYPSGHAANGWLEALILVRLFPERATAILTRARQYGESRFVCGVHSRSAVEAGWLAGSAMFVALEGGSKEFQRDLKRAGNEIASIGSDGPKPDPQSCAAQAAALATPLP